MRAPYVCFGRACAVVCPVLRAPWDELIESVTEACLLTESRVVGSEGAEPQRTPLVTELYCGIGFFTIPLARSGAKGWALESDRSAVADLTYNLRRCGVTDRFEVLSGRVETRGDLVQRRCARARAL